jgi:hypothetical protein
MFDHFRPFTTIVVTGPQRSGTKFAAEIIADELGLRYVNESAFGVHALDRFWKLLDERAVIQAPALSAYCHLLPGHVAVVFMLRDVDEIQASQSRVARWLENEEPRELAKYFRLPNGESSAAVKYDVWRRFQKPAMLSEDKLLFELRYPDDVRGHTRYVPPDERQDWMPQQTAATSK